MDHTLFLKNCRTCRGGPGSISLTSESFHLTPVWKRYALSRSCRLDLESGSCISSVLAAVTKHLRRETKDRFIGLTVQGYSAPQQGASSAAARDSPSASRCRDQRAEGWRSEAFPLCILPRRAAHHDATHSHTESVFSPQLMGSRNTDKPSSLFPWWFPIPWSCQSRLTIMGLSGVTKVLCNPYCTQSSDHRTQKPLNQKGTIVPTPPCVAKPWPLAGEVYYILHYILHLHLHILTLHWISPYKI